VYITLKGVCGSLQVGDNRMPGSKRQISRETIELEIYKTFEKFKGIKSIKVADYLKAFDVTSFQERKYRKIKYSHESLVKLVIFQRLKGIKFYTKLTKYLRKNPSERFKLGFKETPNRAQIGYFINHILDDETKEILDFAASKIEEVSEKFGIFLDAKVLKPEPPQKETKERNQFLQKKEKTREICKIFKKRLEPYIDLNLKNNSLYTKKQFIDLLVHNGISGHFAEGGSETLEENLENRRMYCPTCHTIMLPSTILCKNKKYEKWINIFKCNNCGYTKRINPNADTLFYHLKKYPDCETIEKIFTTLYELIWVEAKKNNLFDVRKHYNVAIDFTEWLFYGDGKARMVVGKKPEKGTSKCYKFVTINIVDSGKRFIMLALPVAQLVNRDKEELLTRLLSYTLQRIKIRYVFVDRGFCDSTTIKVFNNFHLKYLMPCTEYSTVKNIINVTPAPCIITDFVLADATFNLIIVEEKKEDGTKEKRFFATNIEFNENDVNLSNRLFDLYGKRWGIETSYRVTKHSFLSRTTSKDYRIRFFYFKFSVLLYNLWILVDILISLTLFGVVQEKHILKARYFGTVWYSSDDRG